MPNTAIVCFRNDFRLRDNPALSVAVDRGFYVIPVFIYDTEAIGYCKLGGASKWWLDQSIRDINKQFEALGARLILRHGPTLSVLRDIVVSVSASAVFWNRRYTLSERSVDQSCKKMLNGMGIEVESFRGSLLVEPWTTENKEGNPFKVYTPFWKSIKDRAIPEPVDLKKKEIQFPPFLNSVKSESIDVFDLVTPGIKWQDSFHEFWEVSESKAHTIIGEFIENAVGAYSRDRDRPDLDGTSSISPYLRWGQISPVQIAKALTTRCDLLKKGPAIYLKEIYWREFAYYVLYHFPHTQNDPLQEKYKDFPWQDNPSILQAWQRGKTGYPIVDAGMRQLYATGWMHNRVRMIVASLLVKHLLHSWKVGAEWFWDTLVDADLASNSLGWQWSGGCGADAAPYFRIFNPMIQGMKFDTEGIYVARWVPELAKLPKEFIHKPWEASSELLKTKDVVLGETYPYPIVDHSFGRERALAALNSIKS